MVPIFLATEMQKLGTQPKVTELVKGRDWIGMQGCPTHFYTIPSAD